MRLKSCILYTVSTNQKISQQTLHNFGLQHSVRRSVSNSKALHWPGYCSRYSDSLRAGRFGNRMPVGARLSAPIQTGPGTHPAPCTRGSGSLSGKKGVMKSGLGVVHPFPSSAEIKERLELQLYSPSGSSQPGMGRTLTFSPKLSPGVVSLIIMCYFQQLSNVNPSQEVGVRPSVSHPSTYFTSRIAVGHRC